MRCAGCRLCLLVLALLVVSCARGTRTIHVPAGAGAPPELGSSFNVRVEGDTVRFELHITNTTPGPIALEFATAQRYDFAVARGTGEVVWRWSEQQMFAQVVGREVIGAGESRRYAAAWSGAGREGDHVATARLSAHNYPVELRTVFRLPGE